MTRSYRRAVRGELRGRQLRVVRTLAAGPRHVPRRRGDARARQLAALDVEHPVEPADQQDPGELRRGPNEREPHAATTRPTVRAEQDAQPGGVDEVNVLQVDL